MKRVCILLCIALLLSGCGNASGNETTAAVPETSSAAETTQVLPETTAAPEETTPPETTQVVADPAQVLLDTMTLEEKVAQLFIVAPEALLGGYPVTACVPTELPYAVGGVILFAENIQTPDQCAGLIENLQASSKLPLFIAVDEEGGLVARLGRNPAMGTTAFPGMNQIGTTEEAYQVGSTIGRDIRQFGFNLDFAPVADVTIDLEHNVMSGRSFGADPQQVAALVAAAVQGFRDSGVLCTLKHFPGHGNTSTDSHYGYALLDKSLEQLRQVEFPPFQAGIDAGAEFVMLGHLSVPQVTGDQLPASLSPEMVRILRQELGFEGLVITDSLQMGAITDTYSPGQVAAMALEAGVDVILMPADLKAAYDGVLSAIASGELTEARIDQSVLRILQCKYASGILS